MSIEQLLVIGFGPIFIGMIFSPSLASYGPKKPRKKVMITNDQRILRWVLVLIGVLVIACSVLFLEVLKLKTAII